MYIYCSIFVTRWNPSIKLRDLRYFYAISLDPRVVNPMIVPLKYWVGDEAGKSGYFWQSAKNGTFYQGKFSF